MKFWFINNLFVECDDKKEIIETLNNQFEKHIMLQEAGCYKTFDLIEFILRASGNVDKHFISYLIDDLRQVHNDCIEAEHRVHELQNEIKQLKDRLNHAK